MWIDLDLARVDRAAESRIKLTCIFALTVSERVVNVLLGAIDAQALLGDLKFLGGVAVGEEGQDPDQNPDGSRVHAFQTTDIDRL